MCTLNLQNRYFGALVVTALESEFEVATADTNVRSGQIKNNSWLVDSGGGMNMSPHADVAVPGSLRKITGCSAKIGSGELCPASFIGKLRLYGRCAVSGKVYPFPLVDIWIVPKLAFNIFSVGCYEDAGVGFRTRDSEFRYPAYLQLNSGIKIQVKKRKNIYVLDAAKAPNSHIAVPIEHLSCSSSANIRVIHPRRHFNIDLWFVVGEKRRPNVTPVHVSCAVNGGVPCVRRFRMCNISLLACHSRLGDAISPFSPIFGGYNGDITALDILSQCAVHVPSYPGRLHENKVPKISGRFHNRFVTVISGCNRFAPNFTGKFGNFHPNSKMTSECNRNLFLDSKTVKNNEKVKVPKFCGESILSIENTQNVTDLAVSAVSNLDLYQMCTKMRGIPACASLSPNVSMPQTLNAIVCGDCTVPMVTPPNGVSGCMHPGCENPQCAVSFAMIHRSDINKTSPYHKAKSNMLLQHGRFGHLNEKLLYSACKNGRVRGLALKSPKLVCNCKICNISKGKRAHFRPVTKSDEQIAYEDKLESCTTDHIGPMRHKSHGGATGAFICTHLGSRSQSQKPKSRFCRVYLVKRKSQAPDCLQAFQHLIKSKYEINCRHWHMDNAPELKFGAMEQFRRDYNCFFTFSPPYTAVRNREAEWMNHVLCTMTLCMMVQAKVPAKFWGLCLIYAGEIWNVIPSEGKQSPIEVISGVVPDVTMFRVFWCPCFPLHFKEEGRFKFEAHSRGSAESVCRFVGLSFDQPDCWLYYDPIRDTIGSSAHMRFDESEFDGSNLLWGSATELTKDDEIQNLAQEIGLDYRDEASLPVNEHLGSPDDDETVEEESDHESVGESDDGGSMPDSVPDQSDDGDQVQNGYVPNPQPCSLLNLGSTQAVNHVNAAIQKVQNDIALQDAAFAADYVAILCYLQASVADADKLVRLPDPLTHGKAKRCEDWDGWDNPVDGAIKKEMDSMRMQNVGTEVKRSDVPKGTNIVRSKGVFTRKYDEDGNFYHKFRLVACGYSQKFGLDYFETHAGVISITVIRMILSAVAALGLKACQFDIGTAFLECELEEDIYMRLPDYLGGRIWKLNRAIYGLKQSGHLFVKLLNRFLRELGFKQSKTEPQLFTLITKFDEVDAKEGIKSDVDAKWNGFGYMLIGAYIDDVLCASNSTALTKWLQVELENKFKKVKVQDLRWLLGMSIQIDRGLVSMDQHQYCINVIERFRPFLLEFCSTQEGKIKTKKTPAIPNTTMSKADCPKTPEEAKSLSRLPYAELVGCLLFLSNQTRIDIAVAVNDCARFMSCFGMVHWIAALRILQYLILNPQRPLVWRSDTTNPMVLIFHVDASFASCPDTARSRYGLIGLLNGALVCAKTGILKNVRTSSMDAETGALAQCSMQAIITRRYLADMGFPQIDPTPIGEDNNAALLFSQGPVASKRARHIHVDHHFTREQQNEFHTIKVYREPGVSNFADDMTKNNTFDIMDRHTTISMGSPTLT